SGADTNETGIELGCNDHDTLWDLKEDPAQRKDLSEERPGLLASMKEEFLSLVGSSYNPGHESDPLQ
ncbi:MAG: arylsulfatase, partial [Bacteroidales bacterium]|nr:arylsulfatase [Bacteroidales bacterium]